MTYLWLAIVILLTLVEVMTINLTTIWYVASALVSLLISLKYDSFLLQFGVFAVLGTILLVITKPFIQKFLGGISIRTNLDRVIGMEGVVTINITKKTSGEVKVDGKLWTALANKSLKVGTTIKVLEIDGVKLKVEEV